VAMAAAAVKVVKGCLKGSRRGCLHDGECGAAEDGFGVVVVAAEERIADGDENMVVVAMVWWICSCGIVFVCYCYCCPLKHGKCLDLFLIHQKIEEVEDWAYVEPDPLKSLGATNRSMPCKKSE